MKKTLSILSLILLLSSHATTSIAQADRSAEKNIYAGLVDSTLLNFIEAQGVEKLASLTLFDDLSIFLEGSKDSLLKEKSGFQFPPINASASIDNFYRTGDTSLLVGEAGLFTTVNVNAGLEVGGIPLQASGSTILKNGILQEDFSTVSLRFDAQAYKEQLFNKYLPVREWKDLMDEQLNVFDFTPEELQGLKDELLFELYRRLMNDPRIQELQQEINTTIDSLEQQLDTTITTVKDSIKAKYGIATEQLKKIEEQYNKYWEIKKSIDNYKDLKAIKAKIKAVREEWEKELDPEYQLNRLLKSGQLKAKEKWLAMTAGLEVGQFVLNQDEFTINQMSVAGVRYQYQKGQYFGEVAYGKQYQKALYNPLFNVPIANPLSGRHFWLATGGLVAEKQGLSVTALYANDRDEPDSLFTFPKHNLVLATQGYQEIGKGLLLEGNIAISQGGLGQVDGLNEIGRGQQAEKIATEFLLVKEGRLGTIGAGYFYTGRQFISLGNPYLLIGRQGLSTKLSTSWWEDRMSMNITGKYGWSLNGEADPNGFTEWQVKGELSLKVGKNSTITGQFIPNTLNQNSGEENFQSRSNIFALQGFFLHQLKNNRLLSALSFTNLKTDYAIGDSLRNDGRLYLYGRESLNMVAGKLVNLTYRIGGKKVNNIDDYLLQVDYDFPIKTMRVKLGTQLLRTPFAAEWQGGLINRINLPLGKLGAVEWQMTYQRALTKDIYQFSGNLSLRVHLQTGTRNN